MNSVTVRMALYVLSPLLATLAGLLAGWGVAYDEAAGVLSIHIETVVGAVIVASGVSGFIFKKWGVK